MVSGPTAQLVGLIESGRQLVTATNLPEIVLQNSPYILRPVALVTGSGSVLSGMGMNAVAGQVQRLGTNVAHFGTGLSSGGAQMAQVGQHLIGWYDGNTLVIPGATNANGTFNTNVTEQLTHLIQYLNEHQAMVLNETVSVGKSVANGTDNLLVVSNQEPAKQRRDASVVDSIPVIRLP